MAFFVCGFVFQLPYFPKRPFRLGLDLIGGSHLTYQADLADVLEEERGESMAGLRDVIERRVNLFGVGEPVVAIEQAGETQRLIVELPGITDVEEAIKAIGQTPFLEFREEQAIEKTEAALQKQKELEELLEGEYKDAPEAVRQAKISEYAEYLTDAYFKPTGLTGQYLKKAHLRLNQTTFEPEVLLEFNDEGAKLFEEITERNVGKKLAIFIDNVLISAPNVNEKISGGNAQITGSFTIDSAKQLVRNLNAGALPVPIELIAQDTIGPTLGRISLEKSLRAAILGFIGVCLFMLVFYRLSGLLACLSLILYAGIVLALFMLIPVTLTLAGIGGAVLSVGMAVDANVLIFERLKEERRKGEAIGKAISLAFSRAWPSIRDSNFTTLLVALIMFGFGTSFVKGFALVLALGILVSMFSALLITRLFLKLLAHSKLEKVKWLWQ